MLFLHIKGDFFPVLVTPLFSSSLFVFLSIVVFFVCLIVCFCLYVVYLSVCISRSQSLAILWTVCPCLRTGEVFWPAEQHLFAVENLWKFRVINIFLFAFLCGRMAALKEYVGFTKSEEIEGNICCLDNSYSEKKSSLHNSPPPTTIKKSTRKINNEISSKTG